MGTQGQREGFINGRRRSGDHTGGLIVVRQHKDQTGLLEGLSFRDLASCAGLDCSYTQPIGEEEELNLLLCANCRQLLERFKGSLKPSMEQ